MKKDLEAIITSLTPPILLAKTHHDYVRENDPAVKI